MKTISPQDLYRRLKLGHNAVLLDVRPQSDYEHQHIIGALSCPFITFDAETIMSNVCMAYPTPPTLYVISAADVEADEASQQLAEAGYEYVMKLDGGMEGWATLGLPVKKPFEKASFFQSLPIAQQLHIGMGGVVALGTLLGTFANPGFFAIPFLAGMGCIYEGIFGTDYMKKALLKMPWNEGKS